MKRLILKIIVGYQRYLSPLLGARCRFYPSCSEYCRQSLEKNGLRRGAIRACWRILKCHPFHPGGFDPVE